MVLLDRGRLRIVIIFRKLHFDLFSTQFSPDASEPEQFFVAQSRQVYSLLLTATSVLYLNLSDRRAFKRAISSMSE